MPIPVGAIATPLPPHITRSAVLQLLHDHHFLVKLNPRITSCTTIDTSSTESSSWQPTEWLKTQAEAAHASLKGSQPPKYYSITDKNPLWGVLPELRYQAAFIDCETEISVIVEAPAGTRVWQRWTVVRTGTEMVEKGGEGGDEGDGGDEGPWTLIEEPHIETWGVFVGYVKGTLSRAHRENHQVVKGVLEKVGR